MVKYKAKIVGLRFHRISTPVEDGDEVFVMAVENDYDADALAVHSFNSEVIGFIANSKNITLSANNIKRGNKSGTELKLLLDWENKKYSANVVHSYRSCIYIEIDSENWQYIDESLVNETDSVINELKIKIQALEIENTMLSSRIEVLEGLMNVGK